MSITKKIEKIKEDLTDTKTIIAFSGGADSTLLAYIASQTKGEFLLVTIDTNILPANQIDESKKIAKTLNLHHKICELDFLDNPKFLENNSERCFICKNLMYDKLEEIRKEENYQQIIDGNNISDLLEDRPGIKVTKSKNIKTPLIKYHVRKTEIINYLAKYKIHYNHQTTCLATRIQRDEEINSEKLNRIRGAEALLQTLTKNKELRVREIENSAIIELESYESLFKANRLQLIDNELKFLGYERVLLDLSPLKISKKPLLVFKPCKSQKNEFISEKQLPYEINLLKTSKELHKFNSKINFDKESDKITYRHEDMEINIFNYGKIIITKISNKKNAEEALLKVLSCIHRY